MRFSERIGITKARTAIQIDGVDEALRNGLWNALDGVAFVPFKGHTYINHLPRYRLLESTWLNFFKRPLDEIDGHWPTIRAGLRKWFFATEWHEVLDYMEFVAQSLEAPTSGKFTETADVFLKREMSAYRFVGTTLGQVTGEAELMAIEAALSDAGSLAPVRTHLETALAMLSDRSNPDYRNSIKESISAVEAMCQVILGGANVTLGRSLKKLQDAGVIIDPALEKSWSGLYGWTSGAQGIRHALSDVPSVGQAEATYMLVSCSAFVSYLTSASRTAGMKLS
jgi:hypothetical protein